jgi:hypothetical protein
MEAFVLALRGRFVRFPSDRLDPQGRDVREELALMARREGFNAAPLSVSSFCGTPCAVMPCFTTAIAASDVSPAATWEATAKREWSSMSWKITHLRPPVRTYSVASNCHRQFGAG